MPAEKNEDPHDITLTPREKEECMLWTLRGKTAWETGAILGISENTVVKMTRSASQKLKAPNKRSAALKAMKLGLLDEAERPPARGATSDSALSEASAGDPACDPRCWPRVEVQPGALTSLSFEHLATDCIEREALSRLLWPVASRQPA